MTAPPANAAPPGSTSARARVIAFLVTFVVLCGGVAATNILVNPLGYYPTRLVRPLVWSSRGVKLGLLARAQPPHTVVLGSSRVMKLDTATIERVTGAVGFNAGVDSGGLPDDYAILRHLIETRGFRPREVWIGLDLDMFRPDLAPDPRLVSEPTLGRYLPFSARWPTYISYAKGVMSWRELMQSVKALRLTRRGFPPPKAVFHGQGDVTYPAWERALAEGSWKPLIEQTQRTYAREFTSYPHLGADKLRWLDRTVAFAAKNGARVRLFLTPFHPTLLALFRATPVFEARRRDLLEHLARLRSRDPGLVVVDFTELSSFAGDPAQFFDGVHMTIANCDRLIGKLWAAEAGARERALQ